MDTWMYIENSNIFVLVFLSFYFILLRFFFKDLQNNHLSLKALIVFVASTLVLQIGKALFISNQLLGRYIVIFSILLIDLGTILLNTKEMRSTLKQPNVNKIFLVFLSLSILFITLSLIRLNQGYIRFHSGVMALVGAGTVLIRVRNNKNIAHDIYYIFAYLSYGLSAVAISFYELTGTLVSVFWYIPLATGFIFHLLGLTRKYTNES